EAMAACDPEDIGCTYERFQALSKAGDTAGAEKVRQDVQGQYIRDAAGVLLIGKLTAPGGAAPAAAGKGDKMAAPKGDKAAAPKGDKDAKGGAAKGDKDAKGGAAKPASP